MKIPSQLRQVASGFFIIALILFILWIFVDATISSIAKLQSAVAGSILTATIAAVAAFLVNVYVKHKEERLKWEQEIRTKKVPLYEEFIDTMFATFKASMLGKEPVTGDELKRKIAELMPRIITWGSEELINQWNKIRENRFDNSDPIEICKPWDELLRVIRKDLGHSNKKLEKYALMRLYVNDFQKELLKRTASGGEDGN